MVFGWATRQLGELIDKQLEPAKKEATEVMGNLLNEGATSASNFISSNWGLVPEDNIVGKTVGSLNIQEKLTQIGLNPSSLPDIAKLTNENQGGMTMLWRQFLMLFNKFTTSLNQNWDILPESSAGELINDNLKPVGRELYKSVWNQLNNKYTEEIDTLVAEGDLSDDDRAALLSEAQAHAHEMARAVTGFTIDLGGTTDGSKIDSGTITRIDDAQNKPATGFAQYVHAAIEAHRNNTGLSDIQFNVTIDGQTMEANDTALALNTPRFLEIQQRVSERNLSIAAANEHFGSVFMAALPEAMQEQVYASITRGRSSNAITKGDGLTIDELNSLSEISDKLLEELSHPNVRRAFESARFDIDISGSQITIEGDLSPIIYDIDTLKSRPLPSL